MWQSGLTGVARSPITPLSKYMHMPMMGITHSKWGIVSSNMRFHTNLMLHVLEWVGSLPVKKSGSGRSSHEDFSNDFNVFPYENLDLQK